MTISSRFTAKYQFKVQYSREFYIRLGFQVTIRFSNSLYLTLFGQVEGCIARLLNSFGITTLNETKSITLLADLFDISFFTLTFLESVKLKLSQTSRSISLSVVWHSIFVINRENLSFQSVKSVVTVEEFPLTNALVCISLVPSRR